MSSSKPPSRTHTTSVRVRYGETDQMGVVYHAHYLVYCEVGRTDMIRNFGVAYAEFEAAGMRLPVIDLAVTYHKPARYDDLLQVRTQLTELTRVRVRFDYQICNKAGDLLVEAHTVLACINPEGRPRRFPEDFRRQLEAAQEAL